MVKSISSRVVIICTLLFLFLVWISIPVWGSTGGDTKQGVQFNKHELSYYLDQSQVNFVRPGLKFTIKGVTISGDNRIIVTFLITDNNGLPLDRLGVSTPGVVSTSFIAAYIPKGSIAIYCLHNSNTNQYHQRSKGCASRYGFRWNLCAIV